MLLRRLKIFETSNTSLVSHIERLQTSGAFQPALAHVAQKSYVCPPPTGGVVRVQRSLNQSEMEVLEAEQVTLNPPFVTLQ